MPGPSLISCVIPLFEEVDSLRELHAQIDAVARENDLNIEIVFVDDGSRDGSWEVIEELSAADPRVKGVRFRRNFGKAAALSAGIEASSGSILFTLDADLQDDPKEMPRFLAELENGIDVVSGWKQKRHDPFHKTLPSKVFNWMVGRLTQVKLHDHNCGFKCYRRGVFDEVQLYGELHRFVPILAAAKGWRVGEIVVNHRARQHGHSKYGVRRFVKGFLDLLTVYFLTGFAQRPLHLLGTVGLISFLLGFLGIIYLTIYWFFRNVLGYTSLEPLYQRPALIYSMGALLLGAQFVSIGFLAELFTAYARRNVKPYSVAQRTESRKSLQHL